MTVSELPSQQVINWCWGQSSQNLSFIPKKKQCSMDRIGFFFCVCFYSLLYFACGFVLFHLTVILDLGLLLLSLLEVILILVTTYLYSTHLNLLEWFWARIHNNFIPFFDILWNVSTTLFEKWVEQKEL